MGNLTARIEDEEAVCSYWLTPVMDMGTNVQGKTLEKLTISVETGCRGKIKFGYETRVAARSLLGRGDAGFTFEDFDFYDFSFEPGFASSFTARVRERNFNYIRLHYVSEDTGACAVNNMTLTFKAGSANRGIK